MILAIAAMESEYQELEAMMVNKSEGIATDIKYHLGKIKGKDVMLMLSGVGKVNAAYALTTILNNFAVDFVINIGSAGGVVKDHDVKVMDVVIAKKVCNHDVDLTLANRLPGVLPNTPQYFESAVTMEMLNAFETTGLSYHYATIASGDQFVCDLARIDYITTHFEDVCAVEMEAGAIAQICYLRKIPFVVFRSISDVVNQYQDNQMQFEEYIKQASINSARAASKIIEVL